MPKIFISYRRADSKHITDRLHDHMIIHFSEDEVFQDVDNIPFGVDFRKFLSDSINQCDVVLVVIGTEWTRIMQERAKQPNDFVRIEVESALKLDKLVIPVLVNNATMPNPDDLPESVRELCWLNAAIVRGNPDFRRDSRVLADGIKQWASQNNIQASSTIEKVPSPSEERTVGSEENRSIMHGGVRAIKSPLESARSSLQKILPIPFDLIHIPAGQVTLTNTWDIKEAYVGKKGESKTFDVSEFALAKYPVTNAQFEPFLKAGGYDNQQWWTTDGWKYRQDKRWTQPRYWKDSKWNGATQPIVGVSWYEAVAYCHWLSHTTNTKIMLPTEQQWQRSAQGDDGRVYPWGNDWNGDLCNNDADDKGIGKTTPVTQYEGKGDSPFGVVDMAGNVWEWCLTDYYKGSNDVNGTDVPGLRGGSWGNSNLVNFRCVHRDRIFPNNGYISRGFRFALSY